MTQFSYSASLTTVQYNWGGPELSVSINGAYNGPFGSAVLGVNYAYVVATAGEQDAVFLNNHFLGDINGVGSLNVTSANSGVAYFNVPVAYLINGTNQVESYALINPYPAPDIIYYQVSAAKLTISTIDLPTVTISTTGGLTNNPTQAISGSADLADAGSTVYVYDNGGSVAVGQGQVNSAGAWSANVTLNGQGPNVLVAKDTNVAGTGTSNSTTFTLDTVAPTVVIGAETSSNAVNTLATTGNIVTDTLTVTPSAYGQWVTVDSVLIDGQAADVAANGNHTNSSFTISYTVQPSALNGPAGIVVTAHDAAGNYITKSVNGTVIIDTVAPALTATESVTGLSGQTSDVISGTVSDLNGVAVVQVKDGATVLGNATISGTNWTFNASGLADGKHAFTATATDNAGNVTSAVSAGAALDVDVTAFTALTVSGGATLNGVGATLVFALTPNQGVTVSGTPQLTLNDGGVASYTGTDASGKLLFSYTVGAGANTGDLQVTGLSLNGGGIATVYGSLAYVGSWQVDKGPAWAPGPTAYSGVAAAALLFGGNASDYEISTAGPNLSTINHEAHVDTYAGPDQVLADTAAISVGGRYLQYGNTSAYIMDHSDTNTNYAFTNAHMAFTTSIAGIVSPDTGKIIDTTPPALTAGESVAGLTRLTNDTLSGKVSDLNGVASVQIRDGATILGDATIAGGNWTYTATGLIDGFHNFTAIATDKAGNATAPVSVGAVVTVDATPPALAAAEGISGLTSKTSDVLFGGVSDLNGVQSVKILDGTTVLGDAIVNGHNWVYNATGLADAVHNFSAIATDNAGNTTTVSTGAAVIVDTTPPALTAAEGISGLTGKTSDMLSGSVSDLNGVRSVKILDGTTVLGDATINGGGWTYNATNLVDAVHNFTAIATDNAGNTTTVSTGGTVIVDTTPPALTAMESVSGLTKVLSDVLSGTVSDLNGVKAVEVFDGTTDLGAATIIGNTWSYTASNLSFGVHAFGAVATDNAGNSTKEVSAGIAVRVVPPAPSTVYLDGYNNVVTGQANAPASAGNTGPAIEGAGYGGVTTAGTSAGEVIHAYGWYNTILGNGGSDTIFAGQGNADVIVSDTDGNNVVTGAQGNTSVTLGNGDNTISLSGYGDQVTLGKGANTVTGPEGNSSFTIAGGTAKISAGGWGDTFTLGDGTFDVGGMQGRAALTLTSAFSVLDSLDLAGTTGDTFTNAKGMLTVTDANNAVYATVDATATGKGLSYVSDGKGGMIVTLATHPALTGNTGLGGGLQSAIVETHGGSVLKIGDGSRSVTLTGWNNVVTGGTGTHVVIGAQGNSSVTLGGDNVVAASGFNNAIMLGNGTNNVQAGDGNETITVGAGTNVLQAHGWNNLFSVTGNGHATITAGDGNETVELSGGTDVVHLAGWNNLVIGGLGSVNVDGGAGNTYQVDGLGITGGFKVADFGTTNNDVLDLSKVLGNWDHTEAGLSRLVHVAASGNDTTVSMFSAGGFHQVAFLQNAGAASLADLQNHGAIKIA